MGTYSDPALILPGTVGQTELDSTAKKDVASGVAALDAAGALLVPGSRIYYARDVSNDVHIYERTSDEEAYAFHRVGADDYTFYIKESNVWKQFLTESMNVARIASGDYIGNDTVNRAIPHGLGAIPKEVLISNTGANDRPLINMGDMVWALGGANLNYAVTAMDATNFYVGNVTSYENSGNGNTITYNWKAIK